MKKILILSLLIWPLLVMAQNNPIFPSLSPLGQISQQVGNTLVKVRYERPSVRGRKIYGGLVPWNKVWRTGAGYATTISFSKDVIVGGQSVSKGNYSLFTIPNPEEWMVILNKDTSLYGAYDYDPGKDVARFFVKSNLSSRFYETLTIDLDLVPNNAEAYISWAKTQIHFTIETSTDKDLMAFIDNELLTQKIKNADDYPMAADYLFFHDKDLLKGVELSRIGLEMNTKSTFSAARQVDILEKLGYLDKAIVAIDQLILATERRDYDEEKYRKRDIEQIRQRKLALQKQLNSQK